MNNRRCSSDVIGIVCLTCLYIVALVAIALYPFNGDAPEKCCKTLSECSCGPMAKDVKNDQD